ncbi:MAG: flagellar hook-length control protein FliK, partial [Rhodoferax sp.]|nr:flagellar hook-length control protein FliK [Rhodoferax sp.]
LELLAQPLLRWSGQAWPGAAMDWDIAEEQDAPQGAAGDGAPASRWRTRLALSLPTLGQVEARLSIDGNTLQLHVRAAEQTTVKLLSAAGNALPGTMDAQGLQLAGLRIDGFEPKPETAP